MNTNQIAEVVHQVNAAYCKAHGDFGQKPWSELSEMQRKRVIGGVDFYLNDPGFGPEQLHANLISGMVDDGWVYGPRHDVINKTSPHIVPYKELPIEARANDHLFVAVVSAFKKHGDYNHTYLYTAKVANDVITVYDEVFGIGDMNMKSFDDLTIDEQVSIVGGVTWHACHSTLDNLELSWNTWINEFIKEGWSYGEVANLDEKKHPQIKPWNQLVLNRKARFGVLLAVVLTMGRFSNAGEDAHGFLHHSGDPIEPATMMQMRKVVEVCDVLMRKSNERVDGPADDIGK